jgi:membrane-associated HD superfamily phosphohydrolase
LSPLVSFIFSAKGQKHKCIFSKRTANWKKKETEKENFEVIDGVNKEYNHEEEVVEPIDNNLEEADDEEVDVQRINEENQVESNRTRSGRVIQNLARFRDSFGSVLINVSSNFDEIILIGAGMGEGIKHTAEFHVLNF